VRPERCFTAFDAEGRVEALIAYGDTGGEGEVVIELLDLPWDHDYEHAARELLQNSLPRISPRPVALEYILDEPHPWHPHPELRRSLLEQLGFEVVRTTSRWEWRGDSGVPAEDDRLSYGTVADAGRPAFEDALRRVLHESLDRRLRAADAKRHAEFLLGLNHNPSGYALAYDRSGRLVGLFAAARVGAYPIIALIGVVPEQRGRGHGLTLLAAATRHHVEVSGASAIRADTDELNEPMARCFRRAGYDAFATRTEYVHRRPLFGGG
jgi:ribosomal protein S18 acetylase RimI-like enzyme